MGPRIRNRLLESTICIWAEYAILIYIIRIKSEYDGFDGAYDNLLGIIQAFTA